ncbi:MAG TPA: ACT domain-containing protein, partial [Lachnospiraceae bacterium]
GLKEGQIVNKLQDAYDKEHVKLVTDTDVLGNVPSIKEKPEGSKSKGGIVVRGIDDVAVRFSRCCNPIPGDEIVGFVTRGRGISIHRTDCVNVIHMSDLDRSRLIEAEWQTGLKLEKNESYSVEINIFAQNRTGLLVDISKVFTEHKIDMKSLNVRTSKQDVVTMSVSFSVHNSQELNNLTNKLLPIQNVIDVERTRG